MRYLLIILLFACCSDKDYDILDDINDLASDDRCIRLENDDYPESVYPRDECRCIWVITGEDLGAQDSYEYWGTLSPYEIQVNEDMFACGVEGYIVFDPDVFLGLGSYNILSTTSIHGDAVLTCDCL